MTRPPEDLHRRPGGDRRPVLDRNQKRLRLFLFGLVALVYAGAFVHGELHPSTRWTLDSYEYQWAANNLYDSGIFYCRDLGEPLEAAFYSRRTPLYPVLIWLPLKLAADGALVVLLQIGLGIAAAAMLGAVLRDFGLGCRLRWICLAAFLLYPAQVIYTQTVMAEVLLEFLLLAVLYGLVRFAKTGNRQFAVLMNVALALAPLAKPIALFLWIPNLAFWGWFVWRRKRKGLIVLALLPLLAISLWSYRNLRATGHYHFSSIVSRYMWYLTPPDYRDRGKARDFSRVDDDSWRSFWKGRLDRWPSTLWLYARGSVVFFIDPGRFDIYQFLGLEQDVSGLKILRSSTSERWQRLMRIRGPVLVYLALVALLNVAIACGFFASLLLRRIPVEIRVFLALVVGYTVAVVGLTGFSRYRLAIEPYLFIGAAVALENLLRRLGKLREP